MDLKESQSVPASLARTIDLNFAWLGKSVCVHSLWNEARSLVKAPWSSKTNWQRRAECVPVSIVAAGIQRFFFGCA